MSLPWVLLPCQPLRALQGHPGADGTPSLDPDEKNQEKSWKATGTRDPVESKEQDVKLERMEVSPSIIHPVLRSGMGFSPSLGGPAQIQEFWESMG